MIADPGIIEAILGFCGGDMHMALVWLWYWFTRLKSKQNDIGMMNKLKLLNFELTTACPLECPQCYCTLNTGKNMDKDTAIYWLNEAAKYGVEVVNFSGGETLCYPYLYEVIHHAHYCGIKVNVALSGIGFNRDSYRRLIEAGVNGIFISLNGSTDKINSYSRNGYDLALSALELLKKEKYEKTTINWVMQKSNADDFANMIALAEKYCVSRLVVLSLKPDSANELSYSPTKPQLNAVASLIKKYEGSVQLCVESCFSPMLALIGESFFFGNSNIGEEKGCMAGRMFASVNVDGLLSPCRHLYYFEKWDNLQDYWEYSKILAKIRKAEENVQQPCTDCKYGPYCRHCLAINACINHDIYIGNQFCALA